MKMVSKVQHNYANIDLVEGDEFECEEKDVELVKCLGRADPVIEATEQPRRKHQKRAA